MPEVPALVGSDGTIITTPQTGSPTSHTSQASAAALASIAAGGSALGNAPAPVNNAGTTADTPIREAAQPRASDGTFGRPLPAETGVVADQAKPDVAPSSGLDAPAPATPPPEGERTAEEIAADNALQARSVAVPLADGSEVDLDMGDPAIAEVVRSSFETAREAEAIRAEAASQIEEVLALRESAEVDPVGFVDRQLANSPAGQDHLILSLLSRPDVFARLRETVEQMVSDPAALRTISAEQRAARGEYAAEARERVEEGRAVQANLRDVQAVCGAIAMMDPAMPRAQQEIVYNDMLRDLMQYADREEVSTIPPENIPIILARRLTALGLDPVAAAATAAKAHTNGKGTNGKAPAKTSRAATPITSRPAPATAAANAKLPTGQQFVAAQQRRAAVAIPAGGAGSPSVGPDLVPPTRTDGSPMGTAETIAWHKSQLGKGKRALTR